MFGYRDLNKLVLSLWLINRSMQLWMIPQIERFAKERGYYFTKRIDVWFSGTHPWEHILSGKTTRWSTSMWLKSRWWNLMYYCFLYAVQYLNDFLLSKPAVKLDATLHSLPFRPETHAYGKKLCLPLHDKIWSTLTCKFVLVYRLKVKIIIKHEIIEQHFHYE